VAGALANDPLTTSTQELLPILPKDHPDYEENANMVMAAVRRWNKGRS
jgi:hypothetical protein